MRLNQIEISGFKSFPERSELVFDGSVTAIVGPNGCGKSNLIDAISWVLGEQSARSLRGERMEDVIFSGSDARRPTATAEVRLQLSQVTAALAGLRQAPVRASQSHGSGNKNGGGNGVGLASVAVVEPALMVLGNTVDSSVSDSEEDEDAGPIIARDVEVARRLYRSGESEYLIDGQVCRLRDVQDLLMDSGVGVKAYAVIEQGKIGQILGCSSDGAAPTAGGSGGRHQVQDPPPVGRTEARSCTAEPDSRRRHRLRGREAAGCAQAAGGQGSKVSAAQRGAQALGEDPIRA